MLANEALTSPGRLLLGMTELKEELITLLRNNKNLSNDSRIALKKLNCVFSLCKITEAELRSTRVIQCSKAESSVNLPNRMNCFLV
jgi:hypothetical protein